MKQKLTNMMTLAGLRRAIKRQENAVSDARDARDKAKCIFDNAMFALEDAKKLLSVSDNTLDEEFAVLKELQALLHDK